MADYKETRGIIKGFYPSLLDHYWAFCDTNHFFKVQLDKKADLPSHVPEEMLFCGTRAVWSAYKDLILSGGYAFAADKVAEEIAERSMGNYFRFMLRNPFASQCIRNYFRFLDHVAFHLNELSGARLVPVQVKQVSYKKMEELISKGKEVHPQILECARKTVTMGFATLTEKGKDLVEHFRNIDTHRFCLGIDNMTCSVMRAGERVGLRGAEDAMYLVTDTDGVDYSYAFYGDPDISFENLWKVLSVLMANAKKILEMLAEHGILAAEKKNSETVQNEESAG